MAAQLAGEAAIRIVPSLRNFRARVQSELSRKPMKFDIEVRPKVDTSLASKELEAFRAREHANAINLRVKVDTSQAKQAFSQVEHIFKRSAVSRAIRLNIVVLGGDAVYSAAAALGSLSAAADVAVKSLVAVPGALSSAGVAAGVFAASIVGLKAAFKGISDDQKDAAQNARDLGNAQRDSEKAHRDLGRSVTGVSKAYRDARREVQDLNHEVRRGSLDEADALLNLQESMDTLRQGGFKNLTEFRRAQLGVMQSYDDLSQTQLRNKRNQEDLTDAQKQGIDGNDKVVAALDAVADAQQRVADSADRMTKASGSKGDSALAKLAPEAQEFVKAVTDAKGVWGQFQKELQGDVFRGQAGNFIDTLNVSLKNLGPSLRGVAGEINGVLKEVGSSLRSGQNQGFLAGIIGNTKSGLATIKQGIDPLITGLLRISNSSAFPTLAGWIVTLTQRWDAWTKKIDDSGELDKWVQDGIRGLNSLVNTGINLVTFIGSVADAWRAAGGEASGIIGSAEKISERLKNWGESARGQNSMVVYFRQVRDFIGRVVDAFKGIAPTLSTIGEFTREWSAAMLAVVSAGAQITEWIQENTGLLKPLLILWLSFRTIAPIWGALSTAGSNYNKVVTNLGKAGVPVFTGMQQGLANTQGAWKSMLGVQSGAASAMKTTAGTTASLTSATKNLFAPTNNLTSAFKQSAQGVQFFGNQAALAGTKVGGGAGGIAAGLRGAVGGLAAFLGPSAAFAVAMAAGVWAVNKLGEAHRNAAKDADSQRAALDSLKQSIDNVSGSVTSVTAGETAKQAQNYSVPGLGSRNVLEDVARTGAATPQQLIAATNPTQTGAREQILGKLDSQTQQKIAGSDVWKRYGPLWEKNGVNLETLSKAANGDPTAREAVRSAEKNMLGKPRDEFGNNPFDQSYVSAQTEAGLATPSLTDVVQQAQTFDTTSSAAFLRNASGALGQAGSQQQAANQAVTGPLALKPGSTLGGPGARVFGDGQTVKVETSGAVGDGWAAGVPADVGQAIRLPDGRGQITLTPEAMAKNIQGYNSGGVVRGIPGVDKNTVNATAGEFVLRKSVVDQVGVDHLNKMNSGGLLGFDGGGLPFLPGPIKPLPPVVPHPAATTFPNGAPFLPSIGAQIAALPPIAPGTTPQQLIAQNQVSPQGPTPYSTLDALHGVSGATIPGANYKGWYAPPASPPSVPPPVAPPKPVAKPSVPSAPSSSTSAPSAPVTVPATHQGTGALPGPDDGAETAGGPVYGGMAQAYDPTLGGATGRVPYGLPVGSNSGGFGGAGVQFPSWVYQVGSAFGLTPSTYPGHQEKSGLNKGIDWSGTPDQMRAFAEYVSQVPGMEQVIFEDPRDGTKIGVAPDLGAGQSIDNYYRDDWKDHMNHVHTRQSLSIPLPGQDVGIPQLPGGLGSIPGMQMPGGFGGLIPGLGGGNGSSGGNDNDPYSQKSIQDFLGGQAQDVGQTLTSVGLQFLQGMTGLDLSGLANDASSIGNFALGKNGSKDGTGLTSGSDYDNLITGDMSQYAGGAGALGIGVGGSTPDGSSPGVDQWDDTIHQVLMQLASQGLIDQSEIPAWTAAVKRQMKLESGGRNINNLHDSNGKGGEQAVYGLMQMLPSTFRANVPPGYSNDVTDPVANIAASIMYAKGKGGPSYMTGKHGYARGGSPKGGPIRVSKGEFRFSPKAVDRIGVANLMALNAQGFDAGGWFGAPPVKPFTLGPQAPVAPPTPVAPAPAPGVGAGVMAGINAPPPTPAPRVGTGALAGVNMAPPAPPAPPLIGTGLAAGLNQPIPASMGQLSTSGVPGTLPTNLGATDPTKNPWIDKGATTAPIDPANPEADQRGALGAAPTTNNHLAPGIKGAIEGAFQAAGQAGATAAAVGSMGLGGAGGGAAGSLIQGGAAVAGQVASGLANVLSSAGVGSVMDIGTQATPSGAALIPQRAPMQFGQLPNQSAAPVTVAPPAGGPQIVNNYNGGIHTQNMDDWQRRQQRIMDQQSQPYISKYGV